MPSRKFKFVSPGVFLSEVDNSQFGVFFEDVGPVVIGRTERGPGGLPTRVDSFSEFIEVFGNPIPGGGTQTNDPWREGNYTAPTYAAYAAQAYLRNSGPMTIVNPKGYQHSKATTGGAAGWPQEDDSDPTASGSEGTNAGAFGLFLVDSSSAKPTSPQRWGLGTGSLAAILYARKGTYFGLLGSKAQGASDVETGDTAPAGSSILMASTGPDAEFKIGIHTGTFGATINASLQEQITFNFSPTSDKFIRKVLNTSPILTNPDVTKVSSNNYKRYFLGQTFEHQFKRVLKSGSAGSTGNVYGFLAPLMTGSYRGGDYRYPARASSTGWIIGQDLNNSAGYIADKMPKLFKFYSLTEGEWEQKNLKISISNIRVSKNEFNKYGSFDVEIRNVRDSDSSKKVFEKFTSCNLNPNSTNYVARKIGDRFRTWDDTDRRFREFGDFDNRSKFVRVEVSDDVRDSQASAELLPFGFFGPKRFKSFRVAQGRSGPLYLAHDANSELTGALGTLVSFGSAKDCMSSVTKFEMGSTYAEQDDLINLSSISDDNGFSIATNIGQQAKQTVTITLKSAVAFAAGTATAGNILILNADDRVKSVSDAINGNIENTTHVKFPSSGIGSAGIPYLSASAGSTNKVTVKATIAGSGSFIAANTDGSLAAAAQYTGDGVYGTFKVQFPTYPTLSGSREAKTVKSTDAYFGIAPYQSGTTTYAKDHNDLVYPLAESGKTDISTLTEDSFVFSLDDVVQEGHTGTPSAPTEHTYWVSGSRRGGQSITARGSQSPLLSASSGYSAVLTAGFNKFTLPLTGGFNGLDITEKEPFNNTDLAGAGERSNYAYYSLAKAIDSVADPEVVEMNLLSLPGITEKTITKKAIDVCEERGDALAVIDLEGIYKPSTESTESESSRRGSSPVKTLIDNLQLRELNTSYACAYFPSVQIQDTLNDSLVVVPPSIAALGTFASSERSSELWFAPAGFNRGGLSAGAAGLPVISVKERLTSKERDDLYEANINPIASFPAEGIVIFGQKTLQITPSALDRINVRRLMIFIKKEISRISNGLLFEQNIDTTWQTFVGMVSPFLQSVQARFGLTDFRVVLDETTTTADLIDRNVMYAKIFLQPARSIEFIAIDFVVTNTGAGFAD